MPSLTLFLVNGAGTTVGDRNVQVGAEEIISQEDGDGRGSWRDISEREARNSAGAGLTPNCHA